MYQEEQPPKERPVVELIGGLRIIILRMGETSVEDGMTRRAVFAGKITSSSELEALKTNLEMQIDEEEAALEEAGLPTEDDPTIEKIKREIVAIEGLLNFSTGINQRFEDEVAKLEQRISEINKDGALKDKEEQYIRQKINELIKTMQLFKLTGEETLTLNLSNSERNAGEKHEKHIEATINALIRGIKSGGTSS